VRSSLFIANLIIIIITYALLLIVREGEHSL
jgi:hypothetical protein